MLNTKMSSPKFSPQIPHSRSVALAAPPVWMHLDSGPSAFLSLIVADCTGVTAKLTLRTELARLGITSGRIPIKWGSKAIETASAAELKWYVSSTSLVSSVHDWGLLAQCI